VTSVLFENDDVVVVDKPAGLAAIPTRDGQEASLLELLQAERGERLYVVHRIDKGTSGVIVFARNAETHRWLNRQFETRCIEKTYLALVHGVVAPDTGTIDKPLRQFGSGRVAVDPERGKPSVTEFRVIERFPSYTLIQAHPRTGRRHQIRVHLYHLGHPIVGDPLYGDGMAQKEPPRLMLHALKMTFQSPSGQSVTIDAPVPGSFQALRNTLCG
jgi:RluA family pseudouridine synthase